MIRKLTPRAVPWAGMRCPFRTSCREGAQSQISRSSNSSQRDGASQPGVQPRVFEAYNESRSEGTPYQARRMRRSFRTHHGGIRQPQGGALGWDAMSLQDLFLTAWSIPHVTFIEIDPVLLQKLSVLVLKGLKLVMLLLLVNVSDKSFFLTHSHGESTIALLPREL